MSRSPDWPTTRYAARRTQSHRKRNAARGWLVSAIDNRAHFFCLLVASLRVHPLVRCCQITQNELQSRRAGARLLFQPALAADRAAPPMRAFAVGTQVRALFSGGPTYYDGTVTCVHPDGTYDIHYTDGDR